MTADQFRARALALPEAEEREHMGHPDFRVRGKIFASLGPGEAWGMVKLNPAQQGAVLKAHPAAFEPFAGAWGARGATKVVLRKARIGVVADALETAWRNVAPAKLQRELDG